MKKIKIHHGSFFTKLLAAFTSLIVGCVTLFSVVTYLQSSGLLREELERSQTTLLNQAQNIVDKQVEAVKDIIIQLSFDPALGRLYFAKEPKDVQAILQAKSLIETIRYIKVTNDFIENISVLFYDCQTVCSSIGSHKMDYYFQNVNQYAGDRDIMALFNQYQPIQFVGRYESQVDHQQRNVITFAVSLPFQEPEPYATMLIDIKESYIQDLISSVNENIPASIFVLDRDGNVFTSYHSPGSGQVSAADALEALRAAPPGGYQIINGKEYNLFTTRQGNAPYWYISLVPQSYVEDKVISILVTNLVSILCVGSAGTLFSILVAGRLYQPIREIVAFIRLNSRQGGADESGAPNELDMINRILQYISRENTQLNTSLERSAGVIRNRIKTDILDKGIPPQYPELEETRFQVAYPNSAYQVASVEVEPGADSQHRQEKTVDLVRAGLKACGSGLLSDSLILDPVDKNAAICPVILNFVASDQNQERIGLLLPRLQGWVSGHSGRLTTVGVGRRYNDMEGLRQSYIESMFSLQYKVTKGQNRVIYIDELESTCLHPGAGYTMEEEKRLINHIKLGDEDAVDKAVSNLISRQPAGESLAREDLLLFLYNSGLRAASDLRIEHGFNREPLLNQYPQEEREKNLMRFLRSVTAEAKKKAKNQNQRVYEKAVQYIQEHYREDISLQILEDQVGVSASYISSIFSQTGKGNFLDYLNRFRVEKSKGLLRDTNKTIGEVGSEVGIPNANSYNRIFKKYEGITPGRFRSLDKDKQPGGEK